MSAIARALGISRSNLIARTNKPSKPRVVRIVFVIDACDREIIAWSAVANAGISGEMVCDLMSAAVERRFEALKVPHRLEWLSDNRSAYIERQTAQIAAALDADTILACCPTGSTTTVRSIRTRRGQRSRCGLLIQNPSP